MYLEILHNKSIYTSMSTWVYIEPRLGTGAAPMLVASGCKAEGKLIYFFKFLGYTDPF